MDDFYLLITKMSVEQPLASPGSANNWQKKGSEIFLNLSYLKDRRQIQRINIYTNILYHH